MYLVLGNYWKTFNTFFYSFGINWSFRTKNATGKKRKKKEHVDIYIFCKLHNSIFLSAMNKNTVITRYHEQKEPSVKHMLIDNFFLRNYKKIQLFFLNYLSGFQRMEIKSTIVTRYREQKLLRMKHQTLLNFYLGNCCY